MKLTYIHLFILGLTLILSFGSLNAKSISPEQARQNAMQTISTRNNMKKLNSISSNSTSLKLAQTVKDSKSNPIFYIFSRGENAGYVIASADDRLMPILGHTDRGTFESIENLPEALQSLLKSYETAATELLASPENGEFVIKERDEIEPLVELFWGQDAPLNEKCPVVDGSRAPVGCVGLAMAMVMAHHQYPPKGKGSISYVNNKDKQTIEYNFEEAVFDYENMLEYYDGYEDQEEIDAVAELCLAAGVSVKSEYRADGTGTDLSATAFNTYFDYPSEGLALLSRTYFTPEEWDDLVYEELQNDRPLVYRGGGTIGTGGHAFVIDGYEKETGLFHINWGWYGDANGYYNLSMLRPDSSGGTGSNGDDVYSVDQQIVRGLRPPEGEVPTPIFTGEGVSFDLDTQQFTIDRLYCRGGHNEIYPGLKAYNIQTGETVEIESLDKEPLTILDSSATGSVNRLTVVFNPDFKGLADGEYILRPVARLTENETINPGNYLGFYPVYCTLMNNRYVTVTIKDGQVEKAESGTDADHDIEFTDFSTDTSLITGSNRAFTMYGVNRGNTILRAVRVWVYHHDSDELAWPTAERSDFILEPGNSGTFNLAIPNMTNMGGTFDLQVTNYEDSSILYSERIPFTLANSSEGVTINGFRYVITSEEDKTAAVIRVNSVTHKGEIVFPETVEIKGQQYTLTELSNALLISQTGVTKVTLPESVKRIAGSSFNGCSSLSEINLPENLEFMGGGCFLGCRSLTSITIPKNIKSIGDKTFSTSGLTSVELPEGLVSIGKYAFYSCKFPKVIIPSTVETIGDYAFDNSIINVVICRASNPPAIGERTFYTQTYRNASLFVPQDAVEAYKKAPVWERFTLRYPINEDRYVKVDNVWYELTQDFEAYIVPAQNNEIYNLTRLSVPATIIYKGMEYKVTEISDNAFKDHKELTAFSGAVNIRRIGHHAFDNTGITGVSFAGPIEEIGDYAFYNTDISSISRFPTSLKRIGNCAFTGNKRMHYYRALDAPGWLSVPNTLESIGDRAFEGCESLDLLQINSEILYGENVFDGCKGFNSLCLGAKEIPLDNVRRLSELLESTSFYVNASNRQDYVNAFDNPERLFDLQNVTSVEWVGAPEINGITYVRVNFDSKLGNTEASTFLVIDDLFKVIGSANIASTEDYKENGYITVAIAPTVKASGHVRINFMQPDLNATFDINITETANLIQNITLSESEKSLAPNESLELTATYSPAVVDNSDLVWSSSDISVATVDASGLVTAIAPGTATITCKALMGTASAKCTIKVASRFLPGKALDDGTDIVTVADVNAIVSHIMGIEIENFNARNADANQDGSITISDITSTVKMILNAENDSEGIMAKTRAAMEDVPVVISFDNINIDTNETSNVSLRLIADDDYSSIQTDIICPEGLEISDIRLAPGMTAHSLAWKKISDYRYRLIIYSVINDILPSNEDEIAIIKFRTGNSTFGAVNTELGWAATPLAHKVSVTSTGGLVSGSTSIDDILPESEIVDVYNISGVLILQKVAVSELNQLLAPGLYIVVGNKGACKLHHK